MKKSSSVIGQENSRPATFADRLLFVIWLAGKELGVENVGQFADAIDKNPTQLSRWIKEDPRPSWDSIKRIADAVSVDAVWLDTPERPGTTEPPDFAKWFAAKLRREQPESRRKKRGG